MNNKKYRRDTGVIKNVLPKMRHFDAERNLPGMRIPDQSCQEKESSEE